MVDKATYAKSPDLFQFTYPNPYVRLILIYLSKPIRQTYSNLPIQTHTSDLFQFTYPNPYVRLIPIYLSKPIRQTYSNLPIQTHTSPNVLYCKTFVFSTPNAVLYLILKVCKCHHYTLSGVMLHNKEMIY